MRMQRPLLFVLVLGLVVGLVGTPRGVALDHGLVERASALAHEHAALHASMELGTDLGRNTSLLAGLLVSAAFGGELARATVRAATVALGANVVGTRTVKALTDRPRPNGDPEEPTSSFPSGHASSSAALATVVSRRHRRLGAWPWVLVAWIAVSRVFLGLHYPSDVLAGVLLGALVGTLVLRLEGLLGSGAVAAGAPASRPVGS